MPAEATLLAAGTSSESLDVSITFWLCRGGANPGPFVSNGTSLEVYARIQFTFNGQPVITYGFESALINIIPDENIQRRVELGEIQAPSVNPGRLSPGNLGAYVLPLMCGANSTAEVRVTVPSRSAYHITDDMRQIYGPDQPVSATFGYSTLIGFVPQPTDLTVSIVVPNTNLYPDTSATITLDWSSDMRQNIPSIGPDTTDDIQITTMGGTAVYEADSFTHPSGSAKRMSFDVTLSGTGNVTIIVKEDKFTDIDGNMGPSSDTSNSFSFDTTDETPNTVAVGTNTFTIYDSGTQAINSNTDHVLGSDGGGFAGFSDLKLIGNNLYVTAQILNRKHNENEISEASESRAVLFRLAKSARNATNPTIIKNYSKFADSARSPIEVGNSVYFFEGSHYRAGVGKMQSVQKLGTTTTDLGVPWRSRRINPNARTPDDHRTYGQCVRTASTMVNLGGIIYGQFGYDDTGNANSAAMTIKSENWTSGENQEGSDSVGTRIDNWQLLKYDDAFDFRLPVLRTNGKSGLSVIGELAAMVFCYYGFRNDQFIFRPRYQPKASLSNDIAVAATPTSIRYGSPNMDIPERGLVRITSRTGTKEIFSYTDRNSTNDQLTGISRSQNLTTAADHCSGAAMEFLDHVIDMSDASYNVKPINELSLRQDTKQLFNIIKMVYGQPGLDEPIISRNQTSVNQNKPKEREIQVDLTYHNVRWISWLADQYRDFYSNIKYILEINLKPSFYLRPGQFILLNETQSALINNQIYQILTVRHTGNPDRTTITIRSVN